jgi:hypothetical protein
VAATAFVLARWDPERVGWYPRCPTKLLTGLDCPGCGTLRGVHDLLRGDVVAAADHNLLMLVALVWFAVLAVRSIRRREIIGPRVASHWLVAVAVFAVARNLPVPFLGSTAEG